MFEHYAERLRGRLELREFEEKRRLPQEQLRRREAELLLKAVPKDAIVVALDGRGTELTSTALAARITAWRDRGVSDLAFVIGGGYGLDETVIERAQLVLSLGKPTWPHLLVRAMLAEQLYRSQQIAAGHPYHHG